LSSGPPPISNAADRPARVGRVRADHLGRGAGYRRPGDAPSASDPWERGDPGRVAVRFAIDAAWPRGGAALSEHVWRLHRAVVEHVVRGGDIRRSNHIWNGLQIVGPGTDGLCELAPDPDVGLEPGGRNLRNGNHAVPEMGETARHEDHLRRPA